MTKIKIVDKNFEGVDEIQTSGREISQVEIQNSRRESTYMLTRMTKSGQEFTQMLMRVKNSGQEFVQKLTRKK